MSEEKIHIGTLIGSVFGNTTTIVNNHYGHEETKNTHADNVDIENAEILNDEATLPPDRRPSWEEAIPEYLRTGKLEVAWKELRQAGILEEDYRLVNGGSKAEAHFLVTCFCRQKKNNSWKPFEVFWGFTDLIHGEGAFSKEQEDIISEIFRNL